MATLKDLHRTQTTPRQLVPGSVYVSGNGRVKVVVATLNDGGNYQGTQERGGPHIHREAEVDGVALYSIAPHQVRRSKRGYYSFTELLDALVAEDAITVVALTRYHHKYGGGRVYATTVFTHDEIYRVRGWPKSPLTAVEAQTKRIRLRLGQGD